MFRFGFAHFLGFYALVPAIVVVLWYAWRTRERMIALFGDVTLMRQLSASVSSKKRIVKLVLGVGALMCLVTALARPQFGTRVETVTRRGQDVVVALDVSASMLAEDISPNRLEKAKHAVGQLMGQLRGDRIGLVAFAGMAFTQAPLTVDYGAARMFLNAMEPDLIPVPGTDLGAALSKALDALENDVPTSKLIILITDGEDHLGEVDPAVERATRMGVIIHTIGMGSTDGVPIPDVDAEGRRRGFIRDDDGNVVLTKLDEATLQQLAQATGGSYYRATPGARELDDLAGQIVEMADGEIGEQQITQYDEQFQFFLALALVMLTVEVVVSDRRQVDHTWKGRFK